MVIPQLKPYDVHYINGSDKGLQKWHMKVFINSGDKVDKNNDLKCYTLRR